jgi:carbamoyl-phosphate synthase (ammonia)
MHVVNDTEELIKYIENTTDISGEHPVVITKFIENAQEVELDGVSNNGKLMGFIMSEHLEKAGVHSGDATLLLPIQNVSGKAENAIRSIAKVLAKRFQITGPFNLQFLVANDEVLVIECNLRASRSFPFISKTAGANLIEYATKFIVGSPVAKERLKTLASLAGPQTFYGVKVPVFSWRRLPKVDPILRCIMSSTGEVAAFGKTAQEAYLKALVSSGFKLPVKGVLICVGKESPEEMLQVINLLKKKKLKVFSLCSTAQLFIYLFINN